MAATLIDATTVALTGTNLTDATFATLSTGAGNGVKFNFGSRRVIALKNDTGGAAIFTLKLKTIPALSAISVTPSDKTVTVADGKTYLVPTNDVFRNSDGQIVIECNVAGKVAVFELP